jgi:hypothetical protein
MGAAAPKLGQRDFAEFGRRPAEAGEIRAKPAAPMRAKANSGISCKIRIQITCSTMLMKHYFDIKYVSLLP